MRNHINYGEIVATISAKLNRNPDHIMQIMQTLDEHKSTCYIWTICADAGEVFNAIDEIIEDLDINWHNALDQYADGIKECFLLGTVPTKLDMLNLATRSMENTQ